MSTIVFNNEIHEEQAKITYPNAHSEYGLILASSDLLPEVENLSQSKLRPVSHLSCVFEVYGKYMCFALFVICMIEIAAFEGNIPT